MATREPVTILALALHRGAKTDERGAISGSEFYRVGLDFLGGCARCHATVGAYNACPTRRGVWLCTDCVGEDGWDDPADCNLAVFGEADPWIGEDGSSIVCPVCLAGLFPVNIPNVWGCQACRRTWHLPELQGMQWQCPTCRYVDRELAEACPTCR